MYSTYLYVTKLFSHVLITFFLASGGKRDYSDAWLVGGIAWEVQPASF